VFNLCLQIDQSLPFRTSLITALISYAGFRKNSRSHTNETDLQSYDIYQNLDSVIPQILAGVFKRFLYLTLKAQKKKKKIKLLKKKKKLLLN
jgi:hypothetical protein